MAGKKNEPGSLGALERKISEFERRLAKAEHDAMDIHQEIYANLHETARRINDIMVSEDVGSADLVTDIKEIITESGAISLQYITDISGPDISPAARYEVRDILRVHELTIENYAAKMVRKSIECQKNYNKILEMTSIKQVFTPICEADTAIIYAYCASEGKMKRIAADLCDGGIFREEVTSIDHAACFGGSAESVLSEEGRKNCADVYLVRNLSSRVAGEDVVEYAWHKILKSRVQDTRSKRDTGLDSPKSAAREILYYVDAVIPFMGRKPEGLQ